MDDRIAGELRQLGELALLARARAYAPYSRFRVGAALRARDGRTYTGANVENASYGLTICAERTALAQAVLDGAREVALLAVATDLPHPAAPCGLCRQMLMEFAPQMGDCEVLLINPAGATVRTRLSELLPMGFGPRDLGVGHDV